MPKYELDILVKTDSYKKKEEWKISEARMKDRLDLCRRGHEGVCAFAVREHDSRQLRQRKPDVRIVRANSTGCACKMARGGCRAVRHASYSSQSRVVECGCTPSAVI